MDLDLALQWSDHDSFFTPNNPQTPISLQKEHSTPLGDEYVWDDIKGMEEFLHSIENDFNNDPQSKIEVMYNKVDSQPEMTSNHMNENNLDALYVNSSTFLSPVSLEPSSPYPPIEDQSEQLSDATFEFNLNDDELEQTSAMELLNEILASSAAPPSDDQIEDTLSSMYSYDKEVPQSPESIVSEMSQISDYSNKKRKRNKRSLDTDNCDDPNWDPIIKSVGNKRTKRGGVSVEVKKERKKDQNKTAANRYRLKKKAEQQNVDYLQDEQQKVNDQLKQALEKLQMEFKVVLPLAQAAFAHDPNRMVNLQLIQIRVMKENLLD